jgi:AcrR family transcriptional regulator
MQSSTSAARRPVRDYRGVSAEQRMADRRERLLAAGLDEFGTRGFLATGVKDICRAAGLTDRYFYESFSSNGDLFSAVFDNATRHLLDVTVAAADRENQDVRSQARAVIEAYVHALAKDPRLARIIFVEPPAVGPEIEHRMRETLRTFAQLVEATLRPNLPAAVPDDIVRFGSIALVGAVERLMTEWQDGELGIPVDRLIDYLAEMVLSTGSVVAQIPRNRRSPAPRSKGNA